MTYTLAIYGKHDELVLELPLTPEQAEMIRVAADGDLSSGCVQVNDVFLHVWASKQ